MTDPLVRAGALGEQLVTTLREQIVRGEIPPGTHLVEDALADQYDVSRGPVRDALKQLRLDHLVEPSGRRGVRVTGLQPDDVRELYELRLGLEALAVRGAMREGGAAATAEALAGMRAAAADGDAARFAAHDLRFHHAVYEASGNRRLLAFWRQIEPLFAGMLDLTNREDRDLGPVAEDHAVLARAIEARDEEHALAVLEGHLAGSERRILAAMARTGRA